jgi:hypothetical protein
MARETLKFHPGPPCPTLLRPAGRTQGNTEKLMGYKLTPLENRGHMARVVMDFLKYHLGLPSPTPLGRGGGGWHVAVFYPFRHPMPYTYH